MQSQTLEPGRSFVLPALAAVLVVATLGITGFALTRRTREPSSEREARVALVAELDRVKQDVARLQASPAPREVRYMVTPPAEAPPAPPDRGEEAPPPEDPRPLAERERERNRDTANALAARFTEEPVDGAWSPTTTRAIRDLLQAGTAGELLEAGCASTLCRVVLRHESLESQKKMAYAVRGLAPFRTGTFYDYDTTSDPPITTLYTLREGASFQEEMANAPAGSAR